MSQNSRYAAISKALCNDEVWDNRFGADLAGYAAASAAALLTENWKQAMREGAGIETLVHDVDDVIAILSGFKSQVASNPGLLSRLPG